MAEQRRITRQFLLEHLDDNEMDLSMTDLSKVPVKELAQIPRMTKLDLSRNHLTSLPDNMSTLKTIVDLDLSKNQLTELPESFGELVHLQRLDLFENKLTELPLSFAGLERLRWLDLKENPLSQGLAKAAGPCLSELECKQCAKNVVIYVTEAAAEAEKRKKKNMERKLARERKKQEEEKRKREEAKKEKQELKRRRREEREKQLAEQSAKELTDDLQTETGTSIEGSDDQPESVKHTSSCGTCCCCLCVVLILLLVLLVCLFTYCDFVFDPVLCKELWQEASTHFHHVLEVFGFPLQ